MEVDCQQEIKFKCEICPDYKTDNQINFANHQKNHKNQEFLCKLCRNSYIYKTFILHLTIVHNLKPEEILIQMGMTSDPKSQFKVEPKNRARQKKKYPDDLDSTLSPQHEVKSKRQKKINKEDDHTELITIEVMDADNYEEGKGDFILMLINPNFLLYFFREEAEIQLRAV